MFQTVEFWLGVLIASAITNVGYFVVELVKTPPTTQIPEVDVLVNHTITYTGPGTMDVRVSTGEGYEVVHKGVGEAT